MNRMGQEVVDAGKRRLMALQPRYAAERLRHDQQRKVPATGRRTRMPDVLGAVIVYFQGERR